MLQENDKPECQPMKKKRVIGLVAFLVKNNPEFSGIGNYGKLLFPKIK